MNKDTPSSLPPANHPRFTMALMLVVCLMLIAFALFESIEHIFFPALDFWTTHLLLIFLATLGAVVAAFIIFKQRQKLIDELENAIAERARIEFELRRAHAQAEQRLQESTVTLRVAESVASTLDLEPLLNVILDQLQSVVEFNNAVLVVYNGEQAEVLHYRGNLSAPEMNALFGGLNQAGPHQQILSSRQVLIVNDVDEDSWYASAFREGMGTLPATPPDTVRAWMGIPLLSQDRVIGMLGISHARPNYFTPRHAELALAIGHLAAIAIENARLYDGARRLAAVEERQRLARDLHDSVSQALYGIQLGAQTATEMVEANPTLAPLTEPVEYIHSLAQAGLAEMRALIFDLRPEAIETEGLVAGLSKQIASLQARHRLNVNAHLMPEPPVPLAIKETVYRIAQEALHNVIKHAHAKNVAVTLAQTDGMLLLDVRDDGIGFDPAQRYPGHLGLASMCERTAQWGGNLQVTSEPGHGARVHAEIPINAKEKTQA